MEKRLKESKCGAAESPGRGDGGLLGVSGVVRSREKFRIHSEGRALGFAGELSGEVRERKLSSVMRGFGLGQLGN